MCPEKFLATLALALLTTGAIRAQTTPDAFRFSGDATRTEAEHQAANARAAAEIHQLVSVPCRQRLKSRKILQLVAERDADGWQTSQNRYGPFFQIVDNHLRALGLKTYSAEQIRQTIAQAEVDAYFNNDPDAALAASKRLGADYVVRGTISTSTAVNPVVQLNEVAVDVHLTLSSARGDVVSDVATHTDAYSGADVLGTAVTLLRERADLLVAQLYNDFCSKAAGT